METNTRKRAVWPYVLAIVLLLVLVLLVMRNCQQGQGYGGDVPPMVPYTDTLESDTTMGMPEDGYGPAGSMDPADAGDGVNPADTVKSPGDTVVDPTAPGRPQATPPLPGGGTPSMPAGTPAP